MGRKYGLSAAKGRLSRQIGIPLTRSGRERKIGRMVTGGGCCIALLSLVGYVLLGVAATRALASHWK